MYSYIYFIICEIQYYSFSISITIHRHAINLLILLKTKIKGLLVSFCKVKIGNRFLLIDQGRKVYN